MSRFCRLAVLLALIVLLVGCPSGQPPEDGDAGAPGRASAEGGLAESSQPADAPHRDRAAQFGRVLDEEPSEDTMSTDDSVSK